MATVVRRPYETATVLDQDLLDECHDNLTCKLEMIVDIEDVGLNDVDLHLSDRAKYVGDTYYQPRVVFPVISRTIGDWLAGQLEFDGLSLICNNADRFFSDLIPGGVEYETFIGVRVTVKIGLGEIASSYSTIFSGEVSDVKGFTRDTKSFTLDCRNDFEKVNVNIPAAVIEDTTFPDVEQEFIGLGLPVIYGDWTVNRRAAAPQVPAFPVNGADATVLLGLTDLRVVLSSTPIKSFNGTTVTLQRGDEFYVFAPADINVVPLTDNTQIDITQQNLVVDALPWVYKAGDVFWFDCVGVDLGADTDNPVLQGKDILKRFGGLVDADFDASFGTIAAKSIGGGDPASDAIADIPSRIWIQESQPAMDVVLSLYEQIRCEVFVDRANKFHMSTLHFPDFQAAPGYTVKNWDVVKETFRPYTDERNQFNRATADFDLSPVNGEARLNTRYFRNQEAIDDAKGREISKRVDFPNLYIKTDVENQLKEILKLASAYGEMIEATLTWRSLLKDISDEVVLNVDIGSVDFVNVAEPVTARIRRIGYDPVGPSIPVLLWSWQLVPFPGSEKAGVSGVVGGSTATILEE